MNNGIRPFFMRICASIFFMVLLPFQLVIGLFVYISCGDILFFQERMGKDKKIFTLIKFCSMKPGSENEQKQLANLNEVDGPVFKISNDPRFTKIGRFLSHTGLDELPQLINIIRGEMAFIGPRPLPVVEAQQIPAKYNDRFLVLPGLTGLWVLRGTHSQGFDRWMESDVEYVKQRSLRLDLRIIIGTLRLLIPQCIRYGICYKT